MTKIFIGADHAGFNLKTDIQTQLLLEYNMIDCGALSDDKTDYPLFAKAVCHNVLEDQAAMGILICATGIGMSIAANRWVGIRAALCRTVKDAKLSRRHNNANILVLGGVNTAVDEALHIVQTFMTTPFDGGRHIKRIEQIDQHN